MTSTHSYKAAVVQASPVMFDLQATLTKGLGLIREAAAEGASLIVFPEVWLPGYPWWIWTDSYGGYTHKIPDYYANSASNDGPECAALCAVSKELGIHIVMGVSQKDHGSLYITQWIISPEEGLVASRRKLKPTLVERVVFGEGDGSDLKVHDTKVGRLGALSCWEHAQPLIKHVMSSLGEEVHAGSWPHFSGQMPFFSLSGTVNYAVSRTYAVEVGCYVLKSTAVMNEQCLSVICGSDTAKRAALGEGGGLSMIFDPEGREMCEPIPGGEEGILYHRLDLRKVARAKSALDTVGHYYRGDVFKVLFDWAPREAAGRHDRHAGEGRQGVRGIKVLSGDGGHDSLKERSKVNGRGL